MKWLATRGKKMNYYVTGHVEYPDGSRMCNTRILIKTDENHKPIEVKEG